MDYFNFLELSSPPQDAFFISSTGNWISDMMAEGSDKPAEFKVESPIYESVYDALGSTNFDMLELQSLRDHPVYSDSFF